MHVIRPTKWVVAVDVSVDVSLDVRDVVAVVDIVVVADVVPVEVTVEERDVVRVDETEDVRVVDAEEDWVLVCVVVGDVRRHTRSPPDAKSVSAAFKFRTTDSHVSLTKMMPLKRSPIVPVCGKNDQPVRTFFSSSTTLARIDGLLAAANMYSLLLKPPACSHFSAFVRGAAESESHIANMRLQATAYFSQFPSTAR